MVEQQRLYFCYFYILQYAEAWTCVPLFLIGFILLIVSIYQYHRSLRKLNIIIKLTYISIILSLLFYLIKLILSQVVFWLEFQSKYDPSNSNKYLIASKYQFFVDFVGIFFMQTTILLVPANWLKNITFIFSEFSKKNQLNDDERKELESAIHFQSCSIKIVVGYFVIRVLSMFAFAIPFLAIDNQQHLNTLALIILIWWLMQSLFLLIILILGLLSVRQNKKLKEILDDDEYKLMIKHYGLLIGCTLIRFVADLTFSIYYFQQVSTRDPCYVEQEVKVGWLGVIGVINILLQGLVTLYLSVFIILRIYQAEDAKPSEVDSFIGGEDLKITSRKEKLTS